MRKYDRNDKTMHSRYIKLIILQSSLNNFDTNKDKHSLFFIINK